MTNAPTNSKAFEMKAKRHQRDKKSYRELTYKVRVQSFNATCRNLSDYVRVQLDEDAEAPKSRESTK